MFPIQNKRLGVLPSPARVLCLGFFVLILVGALVLMIPFSTTRKGPIPPVDALLLSTSAVCVTGLTTIDPGSELTRFGQVIMMLLIQTGGLGFMTLSTLILMAAGRRVTMRDRLILQEALGAAGPSGMIKLVRRVVVVALSAELLGALLLSTVYVPDYGWGEGFFCAVFHSVSAFCNAGFDITGGTTQYLGHPIFNIAVAALITAGGLGFAVVYDIARLLKKKERLSLQVKVVLLFSAGLLVFGWLIFALMEWNNPKTIGGLNEFEKLLATMFQSVTLRTAGFSPIHQSSLTPGSRILSMLLMFIGASPASAGGGVKTTTFAVLLATVYATFKGREGVALFKRRISDDLVRRALVLTLISLALVTGCTAIMTIMLQHNLSTESLMFESISAFATVGVTMDVTVNLNVPSKILVSFLMYAGRVGPLSLMLALGKKYAKTDELIQYPSGNIMIG